MKTKSNDPAFVYVLAEHKSTPDIGLPLQLAGYMVEIWKRYAGGRAGKLRALPPIIPIVCYHGAANWIVPDGIASATLDGIEVAHMIRKQQFNTSSQCPFKQ